MAYNDRIDWRIQGAVYACGALNHSMGMMVAVIMPLWLLQLNASAVMIGVALGARHFLPLFLSIHGGALMDRFGTRRIMLWFALISTLLPILFPAMPWIWAVIALQMIVGLADTMGWSGAQAMIGQIMKGSEVYAGRLAFTLRIGHFAGPPLIGAVWDWLGPWGAFGTLSLWGGCAYLATLFLPKVTMAVKTEKRTATARDLVPRLADYIDAFRLLAIPAVLFVILVSFVRHSSTSMQNSFYVVYLEGIGISATEIGLLFAASATVGAMGALTTGRLTSYIQPAFFLILSVLGTIVLMGITPLLGIYAVLMVVIAVRGSCLGFSQVLMISILGRALNPTTQGKGVGLRTTGNRVMNTALPPVVGAIVQFAGLEHAFYIVGGIGTILMGILFIHAWRHDAFGTPKES
ncbi:MFS transporter [Alphaproteobacteria bacterium]|nr:MFS transporter [Alphaproteobacteria bacterium]